MTRLPNGRKVLLRDAFAKRKETVRSRAQIIVAVNSQALPRLFSRGYKSLHDS